MSSSTLPLPVSRADQTAATHAGERSRVSMPVRYLRSWGAFTHLVLDLVLVTVYGTVSLLAVVGVLLAPLAGVGLVLLALCGAAAFVLAYVERARLASFVGVDVPAPPGPVGTTSFWRRYVFNGRPWKALVYLLAVTAWGLVAGTAMLAAASAALAALLLPTYAWALPENGVADLPFDRELGGTEIVWVSVAGLVALVAVIPLVSALLARVDVALVRLLLAAGSSAQVEQLSQRVETLTQTRERTVDSVDLERRRIERDLHDGPQQRLVAIAMDLGMARQRLDTDPDGARQLMDKAHEAAKEAITEMRQVARGIHPPVLTDRGLDAALSALAARSPVPVGVDLQLTERPAPTIEAIAYFCVSEALTNVAKHSRASRADVRVVRDGDHLVVSVSDDGAGGARIGAGTGLAGLQDRVAAVDGHLQVESPHGGPTRITVWLPWVVMRPAPPPTPAPTPAPTPGPAPTSTSAPAPEQRTQP